MSLMMEDIKKRTVANQDQTKLCRLKKVSVVT